MAPEYEPRYLAGIVCFNRRDFFEAHEVWESLWLDEHVGADRRFVQGLIQAAVGLFHFGNGNRRGAVKLYGTAKNYTAAYPSPYLGLDHAAFWRDMERCFAELHAAGDAADVRLDSALIPTITLDPAPAAWPDPEPFLEQDDSAGEPNRVSGRVIAARKPGRLRGSACRETAMNEDLWSLENFSGAARLFPLPNLVLFPHVVQPLHVFEPRYRQLTADALAGDGLVMMALLQPGWEPDDAGLPPLFPVACLGRIVAHKELDDGRSILLLRGLSRVRILEETPADKPYRVARVELMPDVSVLTLDEARTMRRRLTELILARFQGSAADRAQLQELFEGEMPLGGMCDVLSYQVPLAPERKQKLLEETDVAVRARELIRVLEAITPPRRVPRKYPVDFSAN